MTNKNKVAIYQPALHPGGSSRVASLLIDLLNRIGYEIVLITEDIHQVDCYNVPQNTIRYRLSNSSTTRKKQLISLINIEKINLCIINKPLRKEDVIVLKSFGIPLIGYSHCGLKYDIDSNSVFLFKNCDITIVLSHEDEKKGRALGINTKYIPNPVDPLLKNVQRAGHSKTIIWVGRLFPEEKQPMEALKVFKYILDMDRSIKLIMLGTSNSKFYDDLFQIEIEKQELEHSIIWPRFVRNPYDYYSQATVHLLTSSHEAFPMTLIESAAFCIPTVMYKLDNIEFSSNNNGITMVSQKDYIAAAREVYKLLSEYDYWAFKGMSARMSFDNIDSNTGSLWTTLINELIKS